MTKKNIVLIILALLFVTGVFFLAEYRNKNSEKSLYSAQDSDIIATSSASNEELASENTVDSDKDGLRDWEEVLWGTDPYKADTDGDGTDDGAEINAGRSPLIKKTKTQDDTFVALSNKKSATASSTEKLTLTDEFGRDIFSKYMELKQSGLAKDKNEQKLLINEIISNAKFAPAPKLYTSVDFNVTTDTGKQAIEQYTARIKAVIKGNAVESRNEGVIVKDSLTKADPEILKELDPIIASYKKTRDGLLATPVPEPLLTLHKNLTNAFETFIFVDESFRKSGVDPILGLQGLSKTQESMTSLYESLTGIANYALSVGVTFNLQ